MLYVPSANSKCFSPPPVSFDILNHSSDLTNLSAEYISFVKLAAFVLFAIFSYALVASTIKKIKKEDITAKSPIDRTISAKLKPSNFFFLLFIFY